VLSGSAKKISQDHSSASHHPAAVMPGTSSNTFALKQQPQPMPRSALKYSSRAIIQQQQEQPTASTSAVPAKASSQQQQQQQQMVSGRLWDVALGLWRAKCRVK
jgi:hypothetical protein